MQAATQGTHRCAVAHVTCLAAAVTIALLLAATAACGQHDAGLLRVEAQAEELTAGEHVLGFTEGAVAGLDPFDLPEPPLPPDSYLAIAFRIPEDSIPLPNRYRRDIRGWEQFEDFVELWEVHVESDRCGAICTVAVEPLPSARGDLRLRVIGVDPGGEFELPLPGQFSFMLSAIDHTMWFEVFAGPIQSDRTSWGKVKSLYRP